MMNDDFPLRILLVDDQPIVLTGLLAILQSNGFACRTAEDGFEALRHLRQTLPDVIICDLNMPNMSGFELLSIVRRRFPQIAVIVLSGEFIVNLETSGVLMNAFFEKGQYKPEELIATIHELHRRWPARPDSTGVELAPLWISRKDETYLIATCTECLRSFPIENAVLADSGVNAEECPSCGVLVAYAIDSIVVKVLEPIAKSAREMVQ